MSKHNPERKVVKVFHTTFSSNVGTFTDSPTGTTGRLKQIVIPMEPGNYRYRLSLAGLLQPHGTTSNYFMATSSDGALASLSEACFLSYKGGGAALNKNATGPISSILKSGDLTVNVYGVNESGANDPISGGSDNQLMVEIFDDDIDYKTV